MKRLIASLIFSLIVVFLVAQTKSEKIVGKNLINNSDIKATVYTFPERIYESYIDTTNNTMTLQLRGTSKNGKWMNNTGNVIFYDLNIGVEKWSKKINYQSQRIQQIDNTIIWSSGKSYCLNSENGENMWEIKNNILYVSPINNIGIGYSLSKAEILQGIDLASGKTIWDRKVSRDYGWNSILYLDDSKILVTAAGLHTLDLKAGTGWDFDGITGKKDYTGTVVANTAGVALGLLTGTAVISTGHNLVRDLVSNTYIEDNNIFIADREKLSCVNIDGSVQWTHTFPENIVSKSKIFTKSDTVYMVNYGYAFMRQRRLDYGIPFIAAFNKNNGEQFFLAEVGDKHTQILNFYWQPDGVFTLIYKGKIGKYSMGNGNLILNKSIDSSVNGELNNSLGVSVYIKKDGVFTSLVLSNPKFTYVTTSDKVLEFDEELNFKREFSFDQVYSYYLKTEKYRFLSKGLQTFVIDENNNEIANFEATWNAYKIGNKLFETRDNTVVETDISEFL